MAGGEVSDDGLEVVQDECCLLIWPAVRSPADENERRRSGARQGEDRTNVGIGAD
jgi:hypothetical protein